MTDKKNWIKQVNGTLTSTCYCWSVLILKKLNTIIDTDSIQHFVTFYLHYFIAITLTWMVTIIFCIPLFFSHSEMKTPSNNSYCDFAENKTIEFLPESWGMRWSILAFKVNENFIFILEWNNSFTNKSYSVVS